MLLFYWEIQYVIFLSLLEMEWHALSGNKDNVIWAHDEGLGAEDAP